MIRHFLLTVSAFFLFLLGAANTPRALIIGIDIYKAPPDAAANSPRSVWRNLNGCVNDAEAMRDLALTRYGFTKEHTTTLFNREATRERIIAELNKLIASSQKGDVVFIYYAGHGSQVVNSLSVEKDGKDETIVPADAYKGVPDIRDKELASYFNQLIDKGVTLTVILDSCHSGSAGRGMYEITGVRYIDENPVDAKDPSDPPKPEERGALILSAAQDFEFAKEIKDENNIAHGAFTLALLKALQQNPANASAESIFSSIKAIMKFYGKTQEPVLAGNEQRLKAALFGAPAGNAINAATVAVASSSAKGIELMGGYAFGLSTGTQLKSGSDTIVITEMIGANRSMAKRTSPGKTAIAPGTLFEVINWTSATGPALRIYLPQTGMSAKELAVAVKSFKSTRSAKTTWVYDIAKETPQRVFHYGGQQWWYNDGKEGKKTLTSMSALAANSNGVTSAFVNFPPSTHLVDELMARFSTYNNVQIVDAPEESMYSLVGTINEKKELAYAFVKTQVNIADSTESLPARTDFEALDLAGETAAAADKLAENVFRIAKIKDWLMLQPPAGTDRFPFKLHIQHYHSKARPAADAVQLGDTLSFYLQKDSASDNWNKRKRYVYLFAIDQKGTMKLLFPNLSKGNVENRLPNTNAFNNPEEKAHLADILVKPPTGYDSYFLLTTEEAIGNLSAFQQPGVVSRGPSSAEAGNALEALLFTGAKSRNKITTPLTWSIDKIILKTTPKIVTSK